MFKQNRLLRWCMSVLFVLAGMVSFAKEDVYPEKPVPARLVNDFAGMLSSGEQERLENKLVSFARTTSTQITVVTIKNLGDHDVSDYTLHVFNKWGIGQEGRNNGVLLLISLDDRKAWITTGKGLEGILTDAKTSRIFRNELRPAFREGNYAQGIEQTADAIIAVTKDEYTADKGIEDGHIPPKAIIIAIIFIILIIKVIGRGGGRGGGGYMSHRGVGNFATGWLIGNLLSGGGRGSDWGGSGGGDWGGGGFGGFGGGSSGGGGAGGSW